jgi:peptide/nickel transport system ATP-binding protein
VTAAILPRPVPPGSAAQFEDPPLVVIRGLTVAFDGVPVLRGIDLDVPRGGAVGIVGETGCGKSVTWLAALGLLPPGARVAGSVRLEGRELLGAGSRSLDRVRGGRIALVSQDPASALNPVIRVGRQVGEVLALHRGLCGSAVRAEARRLFERVGLPDAGRRLDAFPHELSGGQNQRVAIAMALAGGPDLLVADEPTAALDATIRIQILDLLADLRRETGLALVLISHDLAVLADACDTVHVQYAGRIVEHGPAALLDDPAHPYTRGLLAALPLAHGPRHRLTALPGSVPRPGDVPQGCAFAPRCDRARVACTHGEAALVPVGPGHRAACLLLPAARPDLARDCA